MKIMALTGLLGYGYTEEGLNKALEGGVDFIGVDGGSTDPGPYYLGHGVSYTTRAAVKRDIERALPHAVKNEIPFMIGTSGGSGANKHLKWMMEIVEEVASENGLSFEMAVIETEVTKEYVKQKLREGKIKQMGPGLPLTEEVIDQCSNIVSQAGISPFIKVLSERPQSKVIVAGRACDTAMYAAPAILGGVEPGIAFHMAKIIECGAACATPLSGPDCMTAKCDKDSFILEPPSPSRKCTIQKVAAHTMYEQENPYLIYEPDGVIDVSRSKYEQVTDRAVRITNSAFTEAEVKTLKLEGSKLEGYRTICIAGITDPQTIANIDFLFDNAKRFAAENMADEVPESDYRIFLRKYGTPLAGAGAPEAPECSLGIIIDVVGKSQETASVICALVRATMLHTDYAGRKTTGGNLAFPYSPSDIECGPVYSFGIYHLAEVDDLLETSRIYYKKVGE